jgi:hypothetical protein
VRSGLSRVIALLLVAVLALFAGIVLASCGGDDEASPTTTTDTTTTTTTETQTETTEPEKPTVVRITVRGGVPAGGIVRRSVDKGDRVVLITTSDVADEVHLHGYDLSRRVAPGRRARIAFRATLAGRFEVELEERGVPIAELTVKP